MPAEFSPDAKAIATLSEAWGWLLPEKYQPLLFSALGDMFYEGPSGEVFWLNTGTGVIEKVADDGTEFQRHLGTGLAEEWLLPPLIEELAAAGKTLEAGQCYSFKILPIFEGGGYTVENMVAMSAEGHFGFTGDIHHQIRDLPDGAKVRIRVD